MALNLGQTKLIEILDPVAGKIKETTISGGPRNDAQDIMENIEQVSGGRLHRRQRLEEIAYATTSEFPSYLKMGVRPILFDAYNMVPASSQVWAAVGSSDKPQEDYIEGSTLGLLPAVGEGDAYPEIDPQTDRSVTIVNQKYGAILNVTREMVLFDKVNIIRQQTEDVGRALAMTKEQNAYNVLTTSGNYVRNSTTGDNDVGANYSANLAFSASGFVTAVSTLQTMKHRKSGRYLGINPTMMVCSPQVQFAVKQLLLSDSLWRTGGSTTPDVYGTGLDSSFRGVITEIVVSPFMSGYSWAIMEPKKAVQINQVWGPELFQTQAVPESTAFMIQDIYQYRADEMYGIGMLNDRFAFYSVGAAPVVN